MIKPMLAASKSLSTKDLSDLKYPVYCTPKLDGIRMMTQTVEAGTEGGRTIGGFSRKLLPIPNLWIQEWVESLDLPYLDGEIIIPNKGFNDIQSFVMTELSIQQPPWEYHVFDHTQFPKRGYLQRLQILYNHQTNYIREFPIFKYVRPIQIETPDELEELFNLQIAKGYEGLIVRQPDAPYKQGRATFNEQSMLKMKQFEDAEATVIGFEPEYENLNAQTKDQTGAAKRSKHQVNLRPKGQLGKLHVRSESGQSFSIGSGFCRDAKIEIWNNQAKYLGMKVTYTFQPHGQKNNPRCPIFKGFRYD